MATVQDVINEWAADQEEKQQLIKGRTNLPLRWVNQAQLRFCSKAEILRSVWSPSIPGSGSIVLPVDFLREFPDRVKRDATRVPLKKMNYQDALLINFSTLGWYAIFAGTFYVFAPQACSPTVPYIRKPLVVTDFTGDLEIPTEFHHTIIMYMDAMWTREKGDLNGSRMLIQEFDQIAFAEQVKYRQRNDGLIATRGYFF